jgi:hypothetical protein
MDSYHTYGMNCSCCRQLYGPGPKNYGREPLAFDDSWFTPEVAQQIREAMKKAAKEITAWDGWLREQERRDRYDWEIY